jgi:hypothetical protein
VAHGYAVIDAYGVEFESDSARFSYGFFGYETELLKVAMAGYAVDIGIADGYEGLRHILIGHAAGFEQTAMRGALRPAFDLIASHYGFPPGSAPLAR